LPGWSIAAMADSSPFFPGMVSGLGWAVAGMSPRVESADSRLNVVIPEFDGRIVTVAGVFKEKGGRRWMDSLRLRAGCRASNALRDVEAQGARAQAASRSSTHRFIFTTRIQASQIGNACAAKSTRRPSLMRLLCASLSAVRSLTFASSARLSPGGIRKRDALIHA